MDKLRNVKDQKRAILDEIKALKDMRRGSVVEQYYEVRCKDGSSRRQGPYFLYSYKDKGKTVSRRLSGPTEAQRYRKEIAEFRRFEELSAKLIETSHRICTLKTPSKNDPHEESPEKKFLKRSRRRSPGKSKN
jgi:hypothetical protein